MKTYQINRKNQNGETECYSFQKGKSRLDAFMKAEGYTEDEIKNINIKKEGRYLIISDPDYTSATFEIVLTK